MQRNDSEISIENYVGYSKIYVCRMNLYHFTVSTHLKPQVANMRNQGGGKCSPPQSEKSERKIYTWSSKLKISRNFVHMISSRLPATFLSKPIFRPPQGVSPSPAANFLKIPYQNHNVKHKLICLLATWGFN